MRSLRPAASSARWFTRSIGLSVAAVLAPCIAAGVTGEPVGGWIALGGILGGAAAICALCGAVNIARKIDFLAEVEVARATEAAAREHASTD